MPIPGNFLSPTTEMVDPNTSGWVAKLNSVISLGSGGRNGDGCLTVKSVAAGEMQARTVSSVPVEADTLYQTFADASGATVPERIGIRWLSSINVELGITWSVTTAAASSSWHRIGVAGVAPAGAAGAQVVVSSAPTAAGVFSYFENFYLGLPIRTTGNMLDFNAESIEVDTSGWVVESNCTLSVAAPVVPWPVNYYHTGGQMLAVKATAAGNASAKTAVPVVCTPGIEYVAFGHIRAPVAGTKCWYELRFLDSSGTLITAIRSILDAPNATGVFRQIASGTAPAGTATAVLAGGITGATAGQITYLDNCAIAALSQTADGQTIAAPPSGTVVPYADGGFEQGVAGWVKTSGPAVLARTSPWGAHAYRNEYSLQISSSTAAASVITSAPFPLGPGAEDKTWSIRCVVSVGAGGWTLDVPFIWYDADGAVLRTDNGEQIAVNAPGWWIFTADSASVPAGAVAAAIQLSATSTAVSSVLYVDDVALLPAVPTSEISIVPETASVVLTSRGLAAGETITLWRVTANGARTLVRGPDGLIDGIVLASDTFVAEDYEAPLGVPVSYYAEARNADGSLARSTSWGPLVVPPPADRNMAWLKDPANPQFNLMVMVQTPPDWTRPIEQATATVRGRTNKQTRSGKRNGREGSLSIFTRSDDELDALGWLLDSGNALLWQSTPGMGVSDMYVAVGEVTEARISAEAPEPWRAWTLPLTASDMPTMGISGSANRTWQDVLSTFATWADAAAAYATWDDLRIDRRIGA